MASRYSIRGTTLDTFQIGKSGVLVKTNSGVLEARNSGDTDYVDFQADALLTDQLELRGNTISTQFTNADIELDPSGTGDIVILSGNLIGPADPTAGNHVGDRDYNDSRYYITVLDDTSTAITPVDTFTFGDNLNVTDLGDGDIIVDATGGGSSEDLIGTTNATTIVDGVEVGASAVNYIQITNANAGSEPNIAAAGTDTDISIELQPKGAGTVSIVGSSGNGIIDVSSANNILEIQGTGVKMGVDVAPENWDATYAVVQVGGTGALSSLVSAAAGQGTYLSNNAYFDDTDNRWEYYATASDEAARIELVNGVTTISTAAAGTQDTAITWNTVAAFNADQTTAFSGNISTTTNVLVGNTSTTIVGDGQGAGASMTPTLQVLGTGENDSAATLSRYSADAEGAKLALTKSRGATIDSNGIVLDNDIVGEIIFNANDGSDDNTTISKISAIIDDATPATSSIGGELQFHTASEIGLDSLNLAMLIDGSQKIIAGHTTSITSGNGAGGSAEPLMQTYFSEDGSAINYAAYSWADDTGSPPRMSFNFSRGTVIGTHTIVQDTDTIGEIAFNASDGTDFGTTIARITARVDDATPAASSIGGDLTFYTGAGAAANDLTLALTIDASQNSTFSGNVLASVDSTHDIGTTGVRFANIFVDTLDTDAIADPGAATVASGDYVYIGDITDSNLLRRTTAQAIADLGGAGGPASQITVADTESTSTFLVLVDNATGDEAPLTDEQLTYNAATGALTAFSFSTDQLTVGGNTISSDLTNSDIELDPAGTGNVVNLSGSYMGPSGSVTVPTYSFADDSDTGIYSGGANLLAFSVGDDKAWHMNFNGRLISDGGNFDDVAIGNLNAKLQIHGNTDDNSTISQAAYSTSTTNYPEHILAKSRSTTVGSPGTVVADNDTLGEIGWIGDDGTDLANRAARIRGVVDGTPGANAIPGSLEFYTAGSDGTSRLVFLIDSDQKVVVNHTDSVSSGIGAGTTVEPELQVHNNSGNKVQLGLYNWATDAGSPPRLAFNYSNSDTVGTQTIVTDGDQVGEILFNASDGTDFGTSIASILAMVDGASPGASSIGGMLTFNTARDTGTDDIRTIMAMDELQRLIVDHSGGTDTISTGRNTGALDSPKVQIMTSELALPALGLYNFGSGNNEPVKLIMSYSKSDTIGTQAIVSDNDSVGALIFNASDGTDFGTSIAQIMTRIDDAAPAASSIGGSMEFYTSAGNIANDLTLRATIDADGHWVPGTDSTYDLGLTGTRWANGWFDDITLTNNVLVGNNNIVGYTTTTTVGDGQGAGAAMTPTLQVLGTGENDSAATFSRYSADNEGAKLAFTKSRGATIASNGVVLDNDIVGEIIFNANDGVNNNTTIGKISATIDDASPAASSIGGDLTFYTGAGAATDDLTLALTIDASQNATFTGDVILSTGGLEVGGTGNALSYFNESTWTPGVSFGGGTTGITYTTQTGTYTRIGSMVTVYGNITLSNNGSSTGIMRVTGLPFTSSSDGDPGSGIVGYYASFSSLNSAIFLSAESSSTNAVVRNLAGGAGGHAALTDTNTTNTTALRFVMTYFI